MGRREFSHLSMATEKATIQVNLQVNFKQKIFSKQGSLGVSGVLNITVIILPFYLQFCDPKTQKVNTSFLLRGYLFFHKYFEVFVLLFLLLFLLLPLYTFVTPSPDCSLPLKNALQFLQFIHHCLVQISVCAQYSFPAK